MSQQTENEVAALIWNGLLGIISPTPNIYGSTIDFELGDEIFFIEIKSYPKYDDIMGR